MQLIFEKVGSKSLTLLKGDLEGLKKPLISRGFFIGFKRLTGNILLQLINQFTLIIHNSFDQVTN